MSQGNSDPLFDSADFGAAPADDLGGFDSATAELPGTGVPAPPRVGVPQQVHGFTIYTVLLYVSFLMTATAAILLYQALGRY
ncbi:MAG: hypothetical protein ACKO81_18495 [Planctomycetota bacterium]|jgi:hypothetical protein